jgi:hypothetical protein
MADGPLAEELLALERRGWEALCSDAGADYYRAHLADGALIAFPFGVMDRAEALAAMERAAPWSDFEITDPRVVSLGADAAVLVYAVTAHRPDQEPLAAVMSSTYVRAAGGWQLAFHQQSF